MLQIILQEPGQFHAQDVAEPTAGPQQALVRIRRIGVCGTDLHAFAGRQPFFSYPRVLGHELGVEVLEVPENDRGIQVGDRCAIEPYISCGTCHSCRQGKTNCCEELQVLGVHSDGGMQPLYSVPVELLHKSETLTLDQLALVETLGIGEHAIVRSGLQAGEDILIVGAGPIGLAALQFAQAAGGNVRVLELNDSRRAFVEGLGVETLAKPDDRLFDIVLDATGNKQAMESAFQYVAFGGRLVLVGIIQDDISFHDPLFHRREMTLLSSRNSAGAFPKIIRMIEEGKIDTDPWITHRLGLADVPGDFPNLREQPNLVKAMIEVP
jgi:2-desacetyl-2-hydroxyethyl bacteriochlorophyllide A dehydrogenase